MYRGTGKLLYDTDVVNGAVTTRPCWMPASLLLYLFKCKKIIYIGAFVLTGVAAFLSEYLFVRVLACVFIASYHMLETASTQRHGEYPIMYNSFAMMLPSNYAHAASFGIAIHFVLCSGVGKLIIGGRDWCGPETMSILLDVFRESSAPPFSNSLNSLFASRASLSRMTAIKTIFLECFLMPASLFFPPGYRWLMTVGMIGLHLGIALLMSIRVGLLFVTTLAPYWIGFSCPAVIGSSEWFVAAIIAVGPALFCVMFQTLLPEQWPSSAISLFMFNGYQSKALAENFMIGDKRVVLCHEDTLKGRRRHLVGARVEGKTFGNIKASAGLQAKQKSAGDLSFVVHDAVLRVIAFVLLIHRDLADTLPQTKDGDMDMVSFLTQLEKYLVSSERLIQGETGKILTKAFFVRIDKETYTVVEVLESAKS